jgi:protocatechuate 3,4-dioxygenase beta subunit
LGRSTLRLIGLLFAEHEPEDGGLAGAVGPDQPHLLARVELEGGVDEQDLGPVLLVYLHGRVVSADCVTPVAGVLVDVWQADAKGAYHEPGKTYRLRGQTLTDRDGKFQIRTILPGNYSLGGDAWRPAHVHFTFSAPGFASLTTQIYFAGDPYLSPNDGCGPPTCFSNDPRRIVTLEPGVGQDVGSFEIVLASA